MRHTRSECKRSYPQCKCLKHQREAYDVYSGFSWIALVVAVANSLQGPVGVARNHGPSAEREITMKRKKKIKLTIGEYSTYCNFSEFALTQPWVFGVFVIKDARYINELLDDRTWGER